VALDQIAQQTRKSKEEKSTPIKRRMWAIPLWAYALVVVLSLGVIVGLLGLVFKLAKPSEDENRRQQGAPRAPTGKAKRVRLAPPPLQHVFSSISI
jgi:flagellar biosynthesis/type III secretory pathway M-ring protein FliF/YscJ